MNDNLMGQWIQFTGVIKKHIKISDKKITSHPVYLFNNPSKGMIIGERWLPDGETTYFGYKDFGLEENPGNFNCTGTTHCLLVVPDSRTNPIYVDIDNAKLLNGQSVKNIFEKGISNDTSTRI